MIEKNSGQALRPGVGEMLSLNIGEEINRLKAKPEWLSQDRLASSLIKNDKLNVLLMVLKKGSQLAEHRTKGPISLQVISGAVRFSAGDQSAALAAGSMVSLDRDVMHSLESLEESAVLLTTAIG